jgi:hypothetical protein
VNTSGFANYSTFWKNSTYHGGETTAIDNIHVRSEAWLLMNVYFVFMFLLPGDKILLGINLYIFFI